MSTNTAAKDLSLSEKKIYARVGFGLAVIGFALGLLSFIVPPLRGVFAGPPLFRLGVVDAKGEFRPFDHAFRSWESFWLEGDAVTTGHVLAFGWDSEEAAYVRLEESQPVAREQTFRIPKIPVKLTLDDQEKSERIVVFFSQQPLVELLGWNKLPPSSIDAAKALLGPVYQEKEERAAFRGNHVFRSEGWLEFTLRHRPKLALAH